MRRLSILLASVWLSTSCEDPAEMGEDAGPEGNVVIRDAHNYSSDSELTIPRMETVPGNFDICWGDIMQNLQCHGRNPAEDIDSLSLVRLINVTEDEVEDQLAVGELPQSWVNGYLEYEADGEDTCAELADFTLFDSPVDLDEEYVEAEGRAYLLLFSEGTTPGVGAQTMTFVQPKASSTNTSVEAPEGCGMLDFSATLTSAERLEIPADGPWVIDWRNVTVDGQGEEITFENIDEVLLGFYGGRTVEEIEQQILDLKLEDTYTALWELPVEGGKSADLADATRVGNEERFAGFDRDEEGVWLLGLMCNRCQNPAPLVLAVLEPGVAGQ